MTVNMFRGASTHSLFVQCDHQEIRMNSKQIFFLSYLLQYTIINILFTHNSYDTLNVILGINELNDCTFDVVLKL